MASLKEWTNDSLHTLLGFADSALAGYLIHVASQTRRAIGSVDAVLRTLSDGGVDAQSPQWKTFAVELVERCHSRGGREKVGGGARTVTEVEMRKKAAGYSLVDMQDEVLDRKLYDAMFTPCLLVIQLSRERFCGWRRLLS